MIRWYVLQVCQKNTLQQTGLFKEISAILNYREIPYLGSFTCNDERLNKIWVTGAYTVHLNMQDCLWYGVKRDRLVWIGDMHPEVMTINAVFGYNNVVPKSLDLIRNLTPLPGMAGSKQAAALLSLSGLVDPDEANVKNSCKGACS